LLARLTRVETADLTANLLLLAVDGGATKCRARLCAVSGAKLGEGLAGPANIRLGLESSIAEVLDASGQCLAQAGLSTSDLQRICACLALAGATEPAALGAAQATTYPFGRTIITSDARAACIGAHQGGDGGVIVIGTGTIGWAELGGRHHRIGGWGLPVSDEGSGAWLGSEALRRVLWANDGCALWTPLLRAVFEQFQNDPHAIVRWTFKALPHQFGALAPLLIEHAGRGDPVAIELMRSAASHIDALASRLVELGAARICVLGGLAGAMTPWLSEQTRAHLVPPQGDALDGALQLAHAASPGRDVRNAG
jgi:glucosamine kinase